MIDISALTLLDLLERRAAERGDRLAFSFFKESKEEESITYRELATRARALGATLQALSRPGDRVLLTFPPGLDLIAAFFGCAYAGVIAVPVSYARPNQSNSRLAAIAADCQATVALTNRHYLKTLAGRSICSELSSLAWHATDEIDDVAGNRWQAPHLEPESLALLQYTSGSTNEPKGVMISNRNILHNLETIRQSFGLRLPANGQIGAKGVSWLPVYHDMGLIGGILESIFVGGDSFLFSPTTFLRRPICWLEAISRHSAAVSGAPNFAYELCIQKVSKADLTSLDLSSWRVAFCGAEPIRAETLRRFAETFGPCGFREDAFNCCYGLAEATLMVSGPAGCGVPVVRGFQRQALSDRRVVLTNDLTPGQAQQLVGCGNTLHGQELAIVDLKSKTAAAAGQVGEIWIRGPHVSRGYWNRDEENESAFQACRQDAPGERYHRTGDLGFLLDDQLFVAGRLKDLIVIRGRNLHPQDVEQTVVNSHPSLTAGCSAAFGMVDNGRERLVVLQEVERDLAVGKAEIFRLIRRAVTITHEVDPYAIVLVRRGSLPRTSSGKIRRFLCREQFLANELKTLAQGGRYFSKVDQGHVAADPVQATSNDGRHHPPGDHSGDFERHWTLPTLLPLDFVPGRRPLSEMERRHLANKIERTLLQWLSHFDGVDQASVESNRPFAEYGVDSLAAVDLVQQLEERLLLELTPAMAWNYPTPAALSQRLVELVNDPNAGEDEQESVPASEAAALESLLSEIENLSEDEIALLLGEPSQSPQGGEGLLPPRV